MRDIHNIKGEGDIKRLVTMIGFGLVIGALVGISISIFRKLVVFFQGKMLLAFDFFRSTWINGLIGILAVAVLGLFVGILTQKERMIGGSGIPQVAGQLKGKLEINWKRVFSFKFIGGLVALSTGLTVGREGPSVQMGATLGQGVSEIARRDKKDEKLFMTAGAAAGLAAAFNAPLSGIVFVLEELHQKFNKYLFLIAGAAAIAADYVAGMFFGNKPVIEIGRVIDVRFKQYVYVLLLAIIIGFLSQYFIKGIYHVKRGYEKLKMPVYLKVMIPFLITGVAIIFWKEMFGSGEHFIFLPLGQNLPIKNQILILILKFTLLLLAFCSGMPGGIFLPMLVLGSLIGNIFASSLFMMGLVERDFILAASLIGMATNFAAIVRSPITALLLIIELTGAFSFFLPLTFGVLVSYLIIEMINIKPVYEVLLEMLLEKRDI